MAQGHLLIERVAGQQHLEVAGVEAWIHLENVHRGRVAGIGEGLAVFEHEHHIARAISCGGERVAVHRRIRIADVGEGGLVDQAGILGIIDLEGSGSRGVFAEGFQLRGELVDGGCPLALGSVANRAEILEQREVLRGEHVQVEVVLAGDFIDKATFQHEGALGAQGAVEVKALLQMGR